MKRQGAAEREDVSRLERYVQDQQLDPEKQRFVCVY